MQVDFLQVLKTLSAAHNLKLTKVVAPFTDLKNFDYGLRQSLDPQLDWDALGHQMVQEASPQTLILAEDVFELKYAVFALPDEVDTAYILGPWIGRKKRSDCSVEWCRRCLGEESNKAIEQFYNGICRMSGDSFCVSLGSLLTMARGGKSVEIVQSKSFQPLVFEPDMRCFQEPLFEKELPAAMLERRYAAEAAVMDAVEQGNVGSAMAAFEQLVQFRMESRFATPLKDIKMSLVILNVLLRKAIQRSAVHPYYIDRISGRYAVRIENMTDIDQSKEIVLDMLREYCVYVQKYSLKRYSPLVQKTMNYVNLNLNSALSLKMLAGMCYISPSYLSYLFKQETGQTLTDYINTRRVERAARRLRSTDDSVAEIAESVGVLDVNYFTKIFKKSMGVTPTAYRKQCQQGQVSAS